MQNDRNMHENIFTIRCIRKCMSGMEKIVLTTQDVVCIINQCEMGDYDANQFIKAFIR